ncbi:uncharacterized protein BDV14DRAFT_138939 [Aspergillus stella-maris]|uniref:uncharacterized protein n=1 Tax=Aspergillus stella-maris TaxID=1810926 RepID=UPI003CCD1ABD
MATASLVLRIQTCSCARLLLFIFDYISHNPVYNAGVVELTRCDAMNDLCRRLNSCSLSTFPSVSLLSVLVSYPDDCILANKRVFFLFYLPTIYLSISSLIPTSLDCLLSCAIYVRFSNIEHESSARIRPCPKFRNYDSPFSFEIIPLLWVAVL